MPHIVVVGGGVAGLAAAWRLTREGPSTLSNGPGRSRGDGGLRVTLVEASPRLGGKIITERVDGFLIEGGADSFAGRKPRGIGLVRELGLEERLIPTRRSGPVGVYLALGNRLVALPGGLSLVVPTRLGPVARSPLLSWRGKLRVALDLVLPRRLEEGRRGDRPLQGEEWAGLPDESVADFVRRRFGGEYLERVAGPLLGGIHSTDPEELSIEAAFPHLAALERQHRSLLLGVRRTSGGGSPRPSASPGTPFGGSVPRDTAAARVSLLGGMGELVDALVAGLREAGVELLLGCSVSGLEPGSGSGWTARLADGRCLASDAVVLAMPPSVTADLLEGLASVAEPDAPSVAGLATTLRKIPQISTATVSLGLPRSALGRDLGGMGFLVPRSEGRLVSACTFSSLKFPGRAPAGHVLLRAFVGAHGRFRPEELGDEALILGVRAELSEILGLVDGGGRSTGDARAVEPVVARVQRFVEANPQYRVGHAERVRALEAALPPGLALAGCGYHGLGIPDCVASGERAAQLALQAALS